MDSPAVREYMKRPFSMLEIGVQKELAMYLNVTTITGKDWRDVAEKCGLTMPQIKYISTLHGCHTMNFFQELCYTQPDLTIGDMYQILLQCNRRDALVVIVKKLESILKAAESENSQPLDLSTPRKLPFELETPPQSPQTSGQSIPYSRTGQVIDYSAPMRQPPPEAMRHISAMHQTSHMPPVRQLPPHLFRDDPHTPVKLGHVPLNSGDFMGHGTSAHMDTNCKLHHSTKHAMTNGFNHIAGMPQSENLRPDLPTRNYQPNGLVVQGKSNPQTNCRFPSELHQYRQDIPQYNGLYGTELPQANPAVTASGNRLATPLYPQPFAAMPGNKHYFAQTQGYRVATMNGANRHEMTMEIEGPPPLMPIEHVHLSNGRPNSPPPPYQAHPPLKPSMTDWRPHNDMESPVPVSSPVQSVSPRSIASPNSIDSADAGHVHLKGRSARQPVQHPRSSIIKPAKMGKKECTETGDEETMVKRPFSSLETKLSDSDLSDPKVSKKSHKQEDTKSNDKISHAFVLSKLRDTLKTSSENKGKYKQGTMGSMNYSDETERKVAVNQVPTVVEDKDDDQQAMDGSDEDSCDFLSKEKANTYPRTHKDGGSKEAFNLAALREVLSAEPKLESAPFKQSKGAIFLTYDTGFSQQEFAKILKCVNHLLKNAKHQKFEVHMDGHGLAQNEEVRRSIFKKFEEADFVLVCISPTYYKSVKDKDLQRDVSTHSNNAKLLYRMMQKEFKQNNFVNNRFIPVLIADAHFDQAPEWFKKICPRETFYKYPEQLRSLLYHLTRPEKVMSRFMEKQRLARPFYTDPPKASPKMAEPEEPMQTM